MNRQFVILSCLVALCVNALSGCMLRRPGFHIKEDLAHLRELASQTQYDDVHTTEPPSPAMHVGPPRLLTDLTPADFWPMTPEEAVQYAITNSTVLRDLGGTVLRSPETIRTIHNPALQETDPITGIPSALAFFDSEFSTRMFFEKNDRAVNNRIVGLGTQLFQQDFLNWDATLKKRSMTGGEYAVRQSWIYDANNSDENVFGSAWETLLDFEVRQPLLQGAGVGFNQVAGPESVPGVINGVRIARLNTEVSLADYRIALRDLVSNVENAYWDLYFGYRNLEAKIAARDEALQTWREFEAGVRSGQVDVDVEAQARAQYFLFQEEVQIALGGRLVKVTEVNNGSSGGTFRGLGAGQGVLVAERRLRLIMGLPVNDGRVIRPAYDPKMVKVVFDWDQVLTEGLTRRAELQRQRIELRRRQLMVIANRNFLLPRFDAFGRYRFRGLGEQLIDRKNTTGPLFEMDGVTPISNLSFDNAYQNLMTGDFQEWQLGFEFALPVGFRRAHAAVRNSQLRLARARAVLEEQERQVVYDLSNAYAEVYRAFEVMQTAYNRRIATKENYEALDERLKFEKDRQANANLLLDAQRRLADSETRYYRAQVDYMLSVKNMHYEKGSLLDYNEVFVMGDDHRPPAANTTSMRKWQRGRPFNYLLTRPRRRNKRGAGQPGGGSNGGPNYVHNGVETTEDGNVVPNDGWPMVRLPLVSLPKIALPSFDGITAPNGVRSPAQVRPVVAHAPAQTPNRPNQTPNGRVARRTPSATNAAVERSTDGDRDPAARRKVDSAAIKADSANVQTESSGATAGRGQTPTASRPRSALRLPFRSTRKPQSTGASQAKRPVAETDRQANGPKTKNAPVRGRGGNIRVEVSQTPQNHQKPSGQPVAPRRSKPSGQPDYRFPMMSPGDHGAGAPAAPLNTRPTATSNNRTTAAGPAGTATSKAMPSKPAPNRPAPNRPAPVIAAPVIAAPALVRRPQVQIIQPRDQNRSALATNQPPSRLEPAQATIARFPWRPKGKPHRPTVLSAPRFATEPVHQKPAGHESIAAGSASQFHPVQAASALRMPQVPSTPRASVPNASPNASTQARSRPAGGAVDATRQPSLGSYISASDNKRPPSAHPGSQKPGSQKPSTRKPRVHTPNKESMLRMLFGTDDDQRDAKTVPASGIEDPHGARSNNVRNAAPTTPRPLYRLPNVEASKRTARAGAFGPTLLQPLPTRRGVSPAMPR